MNYLVDANVISEATRPAPNAKVLEWLRSNERVLVINPIILGEIRYGIHLLPSGKRRRNLESWFESGVARFVCIPWDGTTGLRWAMLLAHLRKSGRSMPIKYSLIAATALVHDLVIVTRNDRDFNAANVKVLNPFA